MGQTLHAALPYIKKDIPVILLFRALGFVSGRDILEHIIYDFEDSEMVRPLTPPYGSPNSPSVRTLSNNCDAMHERTDAGRPAPAAVYRRPPGRPPGRRADPTGRPEP